MEEDEKGRKKHTLKRRKSDQADKKEERDPVAKE